MTGSFAYDSCNVDAPASCLFDGQTVAHGQNVTAYPTSTVAFGSTCTGETRTCTNGSLSGSATFASCSVNAPASCTFNGQTIAHGQSVTAYPTSTVAYGSTCTGQTRTCSDGTLSGTATFASCSVNAPASCMFNGQTIASGQNVTAYLAATVAYGSTCSQQTRTCTNGTLSGTYTYSSCSVNAPASCTMDGHTYAHGTVVKAYRYDDHNCKL